MESPPQSPPTAATGDQLVEVAVRFLSNPDIQKASLEKRKEFLRKRGLNEEQIAEALLRSASAEDASTLSHPVAGQQSQSIGRPWMVYGVLVGLVSFAGVALFNLYERHVLPYLEQRNQEAARIQQLENAVETTLTNTVDTLHGNIATIQDSVKKIERDVATLQTTVSQSASRDDTLSGIKTEIQTVKSLLLSRNQFASAPAQRPAIPAWQRANTSSSSNGGGTAAASSSLSGSAAPAASASPASSAVGGLTNGSSHSPSASPATQRSVPAADGASGTLAAEEVTAATSSRSPSDSAGMVNHAMTNGEEVCKAGDSQAEGDNSGLASSLQQPVLNEES